jgi:hypothetical protein
LTKRFCKYCSVDITGGWPELRSSCGKPECIKKRTEARYEYMRRKSRLRYLKAKKKWTKGTICLHCNVEIPIEQDIRIPVCLDPKCMEWWQVEKLQWKAKEQTRRYYKNKGKPRSKSKPKQSVFRLSDVKPEDYFDQKMFEKRQAEFNKPNGRVCEYPGCGEKLSGNYRKLCPTHNGINVQKANGILWDIVDTGKHLHASQRG